ncbi:hypothetical protein M422DRAFT_45840 [Sphaerobolus stellatus SS14]|nr:hypothetical protein M422DRAFT_45840 [Sphaerobolus stellatus SS14]
MNSTSLWNECREQEDTLSCKDFNKWCSEMVCKENQRLKIARSLYKWYREIQNQAEIATTRKRLAYMAIQNRWRKTWILSENHESRRLQQLSNLTGIPISTFELSLLEFHCQIKLQRNASLRCRVRAPNGVPSSTREKNYNCILCDSPKIFDRQGIVSHLRRCHRSRKLSRYSVQLKE